MDVAKILERNALMDKRGLHAVCCGRTKRDAS
jgi:hypothetical protein